MSSKILLAMAATTLISITGSAHAQHLPGMGALSNVIKLQQGQGNSIATTLDLAGNIKDMSTQNRGEGSDSHEQIQSSRANAAAKAAASYLSSSESGFGSSSPAEQSSSAAAPKSGLSDELRKKLRGNKVSYSASSDRGEHLGLAREWPTPVSKH